MQSDGNGFCGDVVLYSFNRVYSDEDSIWDPNYESKYFWIFILDFRMIAWRMHI